MEIRVIVSLGICGLECMFLGGLLISWVPILYTFIDDGIYKDKCIFKNVTKINGTTEIQEDCSAQASTLQFAFTLGIATIGIYAFPFGILFDRFGLRVARILASLLSLTGILSWAFACEEYPWLVFVGCLFNGMTLHSLITCNCHAAEMAGAKTGTLIAMFTGCVNFAIFWYSNVMLIHDKGFHRKWSLLIIGGLWILGTFNTFVLLPKFKVGIKSDKKKVSAKDQNGDIKMEDIKFLPEKEESKEETLASSSVPGVTKYMCSILYVSHIVWFCMLNIRVNVFNGTIVPQLMDIYPDNSDKVGQLLAVLGYLAFLCLFSSAPLGFLADHLRSKLTGRSQNLWMKARPAQFTLLIPTGLYIALSVVTLIRMDWAIYTTFVLNWLGVTAFFSYAIGFIPNVFPIQHYGKLFGLMIFSGSIAQFIQVPLLRWAEYSSFQNMLLFLLVMTIAALFHPLLIMYKSYRRARVERIQKASNSIEEKKENFNVSS